MEAVKKWQSSNVSVATQQKYWDNPTMGNWIRYCLTEVASQYTDPYKIIGGFSLGIAGVTALSTKVFFGQTSNQIYHAFRHTDGLGLSRPIVQSAVLSDLNTITSTIKVGQAVNRTVIIGGAKIQYTVFRLSNGNLNIGKIHGTK